MNIPLRDDATERQVQAARPDASTWLSANAGSGKTRVLTDRVARLLLSGVAPERILCLTYTKAAASEMQNRLFQRLGAWAMLEDAALRAELAQLGIDEASGGADLGRARTLFARAIETPGGLKIQTIHSFCAALLRRFPLEAGVTPLFTEMDDRAAELLRAEIVEDLAAGPGPGAAALARFAAHYTGEDLAAVTAELVRHRAAFAEFLDDDGARALFDLPPGFDAPALLGEVFLGGEAGLRDALLPHLEAGKKTDQNAAALLAGLELPGMAALDALEKLFLTGAGAKEPFTAKTDAFPTKDVRNALPPELADRLADWMRRVERARERRLCLAAAERTAALHGLAHAFLPAYQARKEARGWLDFDDLILNARNLLNDPAVAAWVLYRLDGGIDHILVDEAQDTSPLQWEVIEKLAQEFTAGAGARPDVPRTIFVVGDKKQSIYSFQGADPEAFDRMQQDFAARLEHTGTPLQSLTLEYSFRSAAPILRLVDLCFQGRDRAGFTPDSQHRAFKTDLPGRVDLWPVVPPDKDEGEDPPWNDPVDRLGRQHHTVVLARRIAAELKRLIDAGTTLPDGKGGGRPLRPGDIMVLVQRRSDLFHEIIRACKTEGLPIAGADRLRVGAEIAVRDIAALLSFLATPEDDLSLATALRSPLFGWSEQRLYTLAHGRGRKFLWQRLREAEAEYAAEIAVLSDLRDRIDFLRPYELIERILTRHDGRNKLLARLGPEAEDGIDALLGQALAFEQNAVPSLPGFLLWMETGELEIKRQMDSAGDQLRVMTVHGAKGLEAPVVVLPDCGKRLVQLRDETLPFADQVVWSMPAQAAPEAMQQTREELKAAQARERDRLLYVAMTRAEQWLIVAAAGDLGNDGAAWHEVVRRGMEAAGAVPASLPGGEGLRLEAGDWDVAASAPAPAADPPPPPLEPAFRQPAPRPAPVPEVLSPSALGGAKALPGEGGQDPLAARRRGTALHLMLEHFPQLPRADWPALAQRLLDRAADRLAEDTGPDAPPPPPPPPGEAEELRTRAQRLLEAPELARLFAPGTLAEVDITAALPQLDGRRVHGTIDRLIVAPDRVLAVDFKTNVTLPDSPAAVPDGLLRQMGAYAAALAQIYPDRRIETAILWTEAPLLMPLPHDLVTEALRATRLP